MSRFGTSIELARSSWSVLKAEKELLAIPVASFVVTSLVVAAFGGAMWLTVSETTVVGSTRSTGAGRDLTVGATELAPTPLTYGVGILAYIVVTFVVTYFAAALVAGAWQKLNGENPTLGTSFGAATKRIGPIAGWALLSGTVGLLIQAVEERLGVVGQILGSALGMAWRVVTWLAVPVIVVEGIGPWPSLKRSASLFKQTWGENLIAAGGFGLLGFLVILVGMVISGALFVVVPIAGIVLFVLWIAVTSTVLAALNGIYRTALYAFAAGHQIQWFDQAQLQAAFKPKTGLLR
jgi:hypothetical protein